MDIARRELPGIESGTACKLKVDGKDADEARGKTAQGKTRAVKVPATGERLEVE